MILFIYLFLNTNEVAERAEFSKIFLRELKIPAAMQPFVEFRMMREGDCVNRVCGT